VNPTRSSIHNHLIRSLPEDTFAALAKELEPGPLAARTMLVEADKPVERVWFPESGLLSVVAVSRAGARIETGLIGLDGMSFPAVMLADDRSPNEVFVQCPGEGLWIAADRLRELVETAPALKRVLLRYVHSFMIQTAHTALADGRARLDQRLARWLLMAQDRYGRPDIPLTHEVLAAMLGVRRAGVTVALNGLERMSAIRMMRGVVWIEDRSILVTIAAGWYGTPEAEYERLLGHPSPAADASADASSDASFDASSDAPAGNAAPPPFVCPPG
jgi:CRP-like cAMP-binding protein